MYTINNYFNIPFNERVLTTNIFKDTKRFIDPLKIDRRYSPMTKEMSLTIEDFYTTYINEPYRVLGDVVNNVKIFKEPYENHLGYCEEGYHGNGGGKHLVEQLEMLLPELRKAGVRHFRHISFLCKRVSDDVTSDLSTRIIYKQLAEYTLLLCRKYNINTTMSLPTYYWNRNEHIWMLESFELPVLPNGEVMLFIPEDISNYHVSMNHFKHFAIMGIVKYFLYHWEEVHYKIDCNFNIYGHDGKRMLQKDFIEALKEHYFDVYDINRFLSLDESLRDDIIKFYERISDEE